MKIAEGLEVLELHINTAGSVRVMNPTLVWDKDTIILVDAGLPGQLQNICNAMEKAGVSFNRLNKVIITHHDMDHIGSLSNVINESKHKVEVLSHEGEKPYIQGEKRPIKMTSERIAQLEEQMKSMPEDKRNEMKAMYENLKTKVDTLVYDGEVLQYCGGIIVIHTPGHTPGHICLYLKKYKTLITGDALNVSEGQLHGPNPMFTYDMEEAINSLKKLAQYDIETVIYYHGGIFNNNANQRIIELANNKLS